MAIYSGNTRHSVRAVLAASGLVRVASLWLMTASGKAVQLYSAVRACYAAIRWRYEKPWTYKDKWKY